MLARAAALVGALLVGAGAAPVTIAYDQDLPPFSEVADGVARGLTVDVLSAAAARAGLAVTLSPVPFAIGAKAMTEGGAAAYFPLGVTPERERLYDFSAPLVATGGALFVRAPGPAPGGLAALDGKIVVTPGTGPLAALIARMAPGVHLEVTKDYEASLDRLVHGGVAAAALNDVAGQQIAARLDPGQVVRAARRFVDLPLALAVPKGQAAALLAQLNAGLTAIRADGSWQRIYDRWMQP